MDLQADEKCKTIFKQTISGPLVHENTLSYTRVARRQVKIPKAERVDKMSNTEWKISVARFV